VISSHSVFKELVAILRRRIMLLLVPPIITTLICVIGALRIPRMYESSIHLYVQQSANRDPLSNYAAMQPYEDPLRTLDEMVFSTTAVDRLIDSLQLTPSNETQRRVLVQTIRRNITTNHKGDQSFTISFMDSDPIRAEKGVIALTNIFVEMSTTGKKEESERLVDFYTAKVEELRQKFEESQTKILAALGDRVKNNTTVSLSVANLDQQIRDVEKQLADQRDKLKILRAFKNTDIQTKEGRQSLFELQRTEVPYAQELGRLLADYENISQRYTLKHPEVEKVASQLFEVVDRIRIAVGNETTRFSRQLSDLRNQRTQLVDEMVRLSTQEKQQHDKEADYTMYQRLYNEMKLKLEEAEMTKSFREGAQFRFVVLDPAYLPLYPSKPNRTFIVLGGLGVGILIGIVFTVLSELLDTTIRVPAQLQIYGKPVIALLPEKKYDKE
jgi:polysaccharide biosynthesis transport protein